MKNLCVIVGFGPGNGRALAQAFAREGYELALLARSRAKHEKSLGELAAAGVKAKFFEADAADPASLGKGFADLREACGEPSVLIYNAYAMRIGSPSALRPDDLMNDLRSNVAGALSAVQEVLPAMRKAERGTIIFTGGVFGVDPMPQFASVGIGKAALRNLALALAKELAPKGIHVGTVTIHGMVKAGTKFDPDKIAESFLELHRQAPENFASEIDFTGS